MIDVKTNVNLPQNGNRAGFVLGGVFDVVCKDKNGKIKWQDKIENLVVDEGLDDVLDKYLKGSGYTAAFYVLITNTAPSVAAGDTMATHAGWTENTNYDEAVRQTLTLGAVSGQSVDNSASKAAFTVDTNDQVIGGAVIVTDSTKGGTSGTIFCGGAFTGGDKSDVDDNDVIEVTYTVTAADDGV